MYVTRSACIRRGYSRSRDPATAATELFNSICHPDGSLAVFFCSTQYDLQALERELNSRFAGLPLIGCTSAGEITPAGYFKESIAGFSLARPDFATVFARIDSLRRFAIADAQCMVRTLRAQLERDGLVTTPENTFALLLIDGLCKCEELVLSAISAGLGDIPLFGGSSGGEPAFQRSYVFDHGRFRTDAAMLVLVQTRLPFRVFSIDHFVGSNTKMVVTEADPISRIVTEINAEPAGREYARMIGLRADKLTPMIFATHPVVVKVGGRYYTRSIQKVNNDESLTFFCAIDRGIVLTVAKKTDLVKNMEQLFEQLKIEIGPPQLVIGCDCILRAIEMEEKQLKTQVGRMLAANNVIGFSTFGEQFNAMHVNQTFTGAAIGVGGAPRSI